MNNSELLKEVITGRCLKWAPPGHKFTLSSGLTTDHYFDLRSLFLEPFGLDLCATAIEIRVAEIMEPKALDDFKCVGCIETAPIPLITYLGVRHSLQMFYVRKQVKDHGMQKQVEGNVRPGVILVEDVVKTGKGVMTAYNAIKKYVHIPETEIRIFALIDRREPGDAEKYGHPHIETIYKEEDLISKSHL